MKKLFLLMSVFFSFVNVGVSIGDDGLGGHKGRATPQAAIKKVKSAISKSSIWNFTAVPFKGGYIVCGTTAVLPAAAPVWWVQGNKVYSVNGMAKSNSSHQFTYEIEAEKGLRICGR